MQCSRYLASNANDMLIRIQSGKFAFKVAIYNFSASDP